MCTEKLSTVKLIENFNKLCSSYSQNLHSKTPYLQSTSFYYQKWYKLVEKTQSS